MATDDLIIEKVDHEAEPVRRRLIDYLAPHEADALFLIGNLVNGYSGSHLYLAKRAEGYAGLAGYYERPRSICPFAEDPEVVRALIEHVVARHPAVEFVNAVESVGRPAREQMLKLGYEGANDPRQVFMEMTIPAEGLAPVPHEEKARPMEAGDGEAAAVLMRALQAPDRTGPVSEEELQRVLMNPHRVVLEVDGRVVSTATTNGVGIEAFQILGVSTDAAHRGRGYARAVCAALIRRMHLSRRVREVVLFTGPENVAAQRCYAKLGFRITGDYSMAKFQPRE